MLNDKMIIDAESLKNIAKSLNTNTEIMLNILNDVNFEMSKFKDSNNNIWTGNMSRVISDSFEEFYDYSYNVLNNKLHDVEDYLIKTANSTIEHDINLNKEVINFLESSDLNGKL